MRPYPHGCSVGLRAGRKPRAVRVGAESGQATVEFALVLPLALAVLVAALGALSEIRDRVLVVHAARAAARVAASSDDMSAVEEAGRAASPQLARDRLSFAVVGERKRGQLVGVSVRYRRGHVGSLWRFLGNGAEIEATVMLPAEEVP